MAYDEENLDIYQNIESAIVNVYRKNPKMTDYSVITALEAAIEHYQAELRGRSSRKVNFSPLDEEVYMAVRSICDWRMGWQTDEDDELPELGSEVPPETMIKCLKTVLASVNRHNKSEGRQGYLRFVSRFIP